MPLKQLLYVSCARRDLSDAENSKILDSARRRNEATGVTGLLLSIDSGFLQILEGTPDAVDETFQRIERDSRHISVRKLLEQPVDRRSFSGWTMGYRDLRGERFATEGAFPMTRAALAENLPDGLGEEYLIMIRAFCAVNAAA